MSEEQSKERESVEISNESISVSVSGSPTKVSSSAEPKFNESTDEIEPEYIVDLDGSNKDDLPYSCPSPVTNLMLMSASEEAIAPCINVKRYEGSDHFDKHEKLYAQYPMIHRRIIGRVFVSNLYNYDKTVLDLEKLKAEKLKAKEKVKLIKPNQSIGGTKLESVRCYKGLTKNFNVFCPELVKANRPDGRSVRGASAYFYRKVEVDSNGVVVQCPKGTTRVIEEMMNASKTTRRISKNTVDFNDPNKPLMVVEDQKEPVQDKFQNNLGLLCKNNNNNQSSNGTIKIEEPSESSPNTSREMMNDSKNNPISSASVIEDTKKFFKSRIDAEVKKKIYRGKELGYDEHLLEDMQTIQKIDRNRENYNSDKSQMNKDDREEMLSFFNTANQSELWLLPGCSKKSSEYIIANRPYKNVDDLTSRVAQTKNNCTAFLNGYKEIMAMRKKVNELIRKCQDIADRMQEKVGTLLEHSTTLPTEEEIKKLEQSLEMKSEEKAEDKLLFLKAQPSNLNQSFTLTPYQMVGLNWLKILHHENLNGILADEMGLGKTIQAISFLAHLKEMSVPGPHLVICPSSTLDNWRMEFGLWCPDLNLCVYSGTMEERKERRKALKKEEFDVILTSYSIGTSTIEDRTLMKQLEFHYGIFDEAHMLKNIASARFKALMNFQIKRKILLTGTPIQNNLVELMSLLHFVMPNMTFNSVDLLKKMFLMYGQSSDIKDEVRFEKECLMKAKNLLKPFCLRRLKSDVLSQLPKKEDQTIFVEMGANQANLYKELLKTFKASSKKIKSEGTPVKKLKTGLKDAKLHSGGSTSAVSQLMELRKISNHSLLGSRLHYTSTDLAKMAKKLKSDKSHADAEEEYILQDLENLNDYQVHKICLMYNCINNMAIDQKKIESASGKLIWLKENLPKMFKDGHRVLIFSQFVIVLAILQDFMENMKIEFVRLDGSTDTKERQNLIDQFNSNEEIKVFLLSTRAGGQGINLTGADTVILHDIDFNPYNDKQAEDRCHRLGQKKTVQIIRLISKNTIEESILRIATEKLKLEENVTNTGTKIDNGSSKDDGKKRKMNDSDDEEEIEEFTELRVLGSPKNGSSPLKGATKPKIKLDENFAKNLLDELTVD